MSVMQVELLGTYSYKEILNTRMSSFSSPYRSAYKPYNSPYYLHCECRTIVLTKIFPSVAVQR